MEKFKSAALIISLVSDIAWCQNLPGRWPGARLMMRVGKEGAVHFWRHTGQWSHFPDESESEWRQWKWMMKVNMKSWKIRGGVSGWCCHCPDNEEDNSKSDRKLWGARSNFKGNFEKEIGNEGRVITSSAGMYFKCIYDMFFKLKNFRHLVVWMLERILPLFLFLLGHV